VPLPLLLPCRWLSCRCRTVLHQSVVYKKARNCTKMKANNCTKEYEKARNSTKE